MGKNPFEVIRTIFWDPLFGEFAFYLRGQLLVKAGPLILIAIGLALGFRAGIWNIGAEGQYIMGAIIGAAVGLAVFPTESRLIFPVMVVAGAFGGWAWAMIPAILKTRFNTNEILCQPDAGLCGRDDPGQGRDRVPEEPRGHGLSRQPQLLQLSGGAERASSYEPLGLHWGGVAALVTAVLAYILLTRHQAGFQIRLAGQAPRAARFHGVSPARLVVLCMGISGALAGMAGLFEVTGPAGQITIDFNTGYGFTAIIVAFLGRLNPLGHRAGGLPDGADLCGRRDGLDQPWPAGCGDPGVPGDAAVLPSGGGCADQLPLPAVVRRRKRGGEVMDLGGINPVILIATLMATCGADPAGRAGRDGGGARGRPEPGRRGDDGHRRLGRFRHRGRRREARCWASSAGRWRGRLLSLVFALLTQVFLANQVATGLALTLFGLGLSSRWAGRATTGSSRRRPGSFCPDALADLPVVGPILFGHDWVVYFSIVDVAVLWWVLKSTRIGLIIRAVGESHEAAHALGYKVNRIRLMCIAFGGAMAGMGGA